HIVVMIKLKHTVGGLAATNLVLETFRLNGRLLEAGDNLVCDIGLTSARWRVLGAVAASPVALPVSHIARNMGLTRQAVQRLANDLEQEGLIRFAPDPHHERAKLVFMYTFVVPEASRIKWLLWHGNQQARATRGEAVQCTRTCRVMPTTPR